MVHKTLYYTVENIFTSFKYPKCQHVVFIFSNLRWFFGWVKQLRCNPQWMKPLIFTIINFLSSISIKYYFKATQILALAKTPKHQDGGWRGGEFEEPALRSSAPGPSLQKTDRGQFMIMQARYPQTSHML